MENKLEDRVLNRSTLPMIVDDWQRTGNTQTEIHININVNVTGTVPSPQKRGGLMKTFVVLTPGEDGYIVAECPALPGCITQGKTKEEAIENIKEAIDLCREVRKDMGFPDFAEVVEMEV